MQSSKQSSSVVLITGASTGIGRATALALAQAGYTVIAGVRRLEDGASLQAASPRSIEPIVLDVTSADDIASARVRIETITAGRGLHALINNAGFNYNAPYEYTNIAKARALIEVNLFGLHALSVAMLPLLRMNAQGSGTTSKLINLGSVGSLVGIPWEAFYHASKFAVLGLSESIRNEVHAQGIRVCVVLPGGIKTPFIEKTRAGLSDAAAGMPLEGTKLYGKGLKALSDASGLVDRLGSAPEAVAIRIVKLIGQRNPPFRAMVGLDARVLVLMQSMLPTRYFHAYLRRQFGC
jgi:short-subunit dehydrogenase